MNLKNILLAALQRIVRLVSLRKQKRFTTRGLLTATLLLMSIISSQLVHADIILESEADNIGPAGATTLVITNPVGTAVDDLLVAAIGTKDDNLDITAPVGWTEIFEVANGNHADLAVFYKRADAADVAATDFTFGLTAGREVAGGILRYSGVVTSGSPIDTFATGPGKSTTPTAPDVTTTAIESRVLRLYSQKDNNQIALTPPPGTVERVEVNSANKVTLAVADATQNGIGATGTGVFTGNADKEWIAATVVLIAQPKPAVTIDKDTSTVGNVIVPGTVDYSIVVTNTDTLADLTALGVIVSDTLPSGFTFASGAPVGFSGCADTVVDTQPSVGASSLTWGSWDMEENCVITINFTVNVDGGSGLGIVNNAASVSGSNIDTATDPGTDTDEDVNIICGAEDFFNSASVSSIELDSDLSDNSDAVCTTFEQGGLIAGRVWLDEDQDGINDIEETGLTSITVEAQDGTCTPGTDCPTVITDQFGNYVFTDLAAGSYTIVVFDTVQPPFPTDLTLTAGQFGAGGDPRMVILPIGGEVKNVDFGYIPNASDRGIIGDRVWSDANENGIQDAGEAGIAGVTLELRTPGPDGLLGTGDDVLIAGPVTTAADGDYFFTNVPFGEYGVVITDTGGILAGFTATIGPQSEGGLISNPVTLSAALTTVTDLDFGFDRDLDDTITITDRVWYDSDGDQTQNGSEPGIAGVSVDLLDSAGNVVATAITDANGDFTFSGVLEGSNYSLTVSDRTGQLAGMLETTTTGGTQIIAGSLTAAAAAGANPVPGIDSLTLNTIGDDATPTFGFNNPGSVAGTVWSDADASEVQDNGESGIGGVVVTLTPPAGIDLGNGAGVAITTTTAADGSYLFDGLPPGDYDIDILSPPAGTHTQDPDGDDDNNATVSLAVGQGAADQDFGYQNLALFDIDGAVFLDTDKDGVKEVFGNDGLPLTLGDNEPGIAGVTLALLNASGDVIATTVSADGTTDANGDLFIDELDLGYYQFPDLPDANYVVAVTDVTGQLAGYDITSGLDALPVSLAGADVGDVDFGYVKDEATGSISGEVFIDENGNDLAEGEEFDLSGVTVYLCLAADAPCIAGNAIATTTTDANGEYVFNGLPSGVYEVGVDEDTTAPILFPENLILGADPAPVALSEGENATEVDIGYDPAASTGILSGVVWIDADGNGSFDPGEAPIPGVIIEVRNNVDFGIEATATTAADGSWIITGILPADFADAFYVRYNSTDPALNLPLRDLNSVQPTNFLFGLDLYGDLDLAIAPGNNIGSLDFGFAPNVTADLRSISGTVYSDGNQDGDYMAADDGEFQGVTLNLIDCGIGTCSDGDESAIATTITDANGNYSFTGLPPGVYQVVVSDINNVLQDLNPNELLPASVDVTAVDMMNVDAGYVSGGDSLTLDPIGNKFWFDTNGDGIVDDTEPGIEGITIQVWLDNDASATPDTPGGGACPNPGTPSQAPQPGIDNLVRTVTTDQNGEYYFTDLPAGQYIVVVSDSLGFTEVADGTCVNGSAADNNAKPWTYALTHNGTAPNLAADFGVSGANSLSGNVFEETQGTTADGLFNGTDVVAEGVPVLLYLQQPDLSFLLVQTAITDAFGNYSFIGLPDGNYQVVVQTDGTVVDGAGQTADPDEVGVCVTCDDMHTVSLSLGAAVTGIDFGYQKVKTETPVTVNYFTAVSVGGGVEFSWETSNEVGHVAFQIYARTKDGWTLLNEDLIESIAGGAMDRRQYRYTAYGAEARWFSLVDVSAAEKVTPHGPYRVDKAYGSELQRAPEFDWNGIKPPAPGKTQIEDSVNHRLQNLLEADERAARDNPGTE